MSFMRLLDSMWNCFCSDEAEMEAVITPGQNHEQRQLQFNISSSPEHAFPPMAAPDPHVAMSTLHVRRPPGSSMISSIITGSTSAADNVACPVPGEGMILEVPNLRIFTFAELKAATRNFKPDNILGEGGFGHVYKGWIGERTTNASSSSATVIAVKRLNPESRQGLQEWQSEVNFLGRMSHPNLVRLLGYCMEDRELLLVYEFMAKGSLENHLFRKGGSIQPIPWGLRMQIAIGAARGLAFLHSSQTHVIYRDFKSSNILLDMHYNAKISDFGLAKNGPADGHSHITTRVIGTFGYAAPEYVSSGHLYVKSDVYGFGVVLLEMLTGLRALDTARPAPQVYLVNWAKPYLADRRKLAQLVDPHLDGQYAYAAALSAAQLTLSCLSDDPKDRPSMAEVVAALEKNERMKRPPHGRSSTARIVQGHKRTPVSHGGGRVNLTV